MMQKFQTKETVIKNDENNTWLYYTNDDIQGDYSVKIKVGSMQRPNDQMQTEILMNVLPGFMQMMKPDGSPMFNAEEVFRMIMKKSGFTETEIAKATATERPVQPEVTQPPTEPFGGQPQGLPPIDELLGAIGGNGGF
jgi:hypothetical protein